MPECHVPNGIPSARRRFAAAVLAGTTVLGACLMASGNLPAMARQAASGDDTMPEKMERGATRVKGIEDAEMDYQLMRQLGSARYGGAAVGEVLALARQIKSGSPASWIDAFSAAAKRTEQDAEARAARGHRVSAREQYLVASNSYRAAEYYSGVSDPQHAAYGLKSRECFLKAMALADHEFEVVSLPFGETPLPAYYVRTPKPGAKRKTLMIVSGYDGTLEETYLAYGQAALARGYDLMLFAGPGQMDTMRFHPRLAFIPEFERVGRVALEHVLSRPGTDPNRVALMGISFGGYFATRMAAHEPRFRALIANSPIVDLHAYMIAFAGLDPAQMPDADNFGVADVERIPETVMPPQTRLMASNLMLRLDRDGFKQAYQRLRDFRVSDGDLRRIACPSLGLVGTGEGKEALTQFERFRKQVSGPVSSHVFTAAEGADGHCQSGNLAYSAAVSLDWLDEVFAKAP